MIKADPDQPFAMMIINHMDDYYLRVYDPESGQIYDNVELFTQEARVDFSGVDAALATKISKIEPPGKTAAQGTKTKTPGPSTQTPSASNGAGSATAGTDTTKGTTDSGKTAGAGTTPPPPPSPEKLKSSEASDDEAEFDTDGIEVYTTHYTISYIDEVMELMDHVNSKNNARDEAERVADLVGDTLRDDGDFHILNVLCFYKPDDWEAECVDHETGARQEAKSHFVEHLLDSEIDGELLCLAIEATEDILTAKDTSDIEEAVLRWAATTMLYNTTSLEEATAL